MVAPEGPSDDLGEVIGQGYLITSRIGQHKGERLCLEETEPGLPAEVVREQAGVEAGVAVSEEEVEDRDVWEGQKPVPVLQEAAFVPIAATVSSIRQAHPATT